MIVKPLPDEYVEILVRAQEEGVWKSGEDYLIPNRRPGAVKHRERSDKVIWETVKKVARRAGLEATVHALRATFAVQFDEANPDQFDRAEGTDGAHTDRDNTRLFAPQEQGEGDGGRSDTLLGRRGTLPVSAA